MESKPPSKARRRSSLVYFLLLPGRALLSIALASRGLLLVAIVVALIFLRRARWPRRHALRELGIKLRADVPAAVAAMKRGAVIVGRLTSILAKTIGARFKSKFLSSVTAGIGGPVTALVTLFGIRIASESLELPTGVKGLVEKSGVFLSVITLTWALANAYDAIHKGVFEPYARKPGAAVDLHLFVVFRTILNVLIWVVGVASGRSRATIVSAR